MKEQKVETWIKAGYKLVASEGLDGLKVERVAHALQLNKSGFYHYFGDMKTYSDCLLQHHVHLATEIGEEVRRCKVIDPDLLRLIIRNKLFFLVESQLLVKSKNVDSHGIDEVGRILGKEFLPLCKKASKLPEDSTVALAYLDILRHFFYSRINSENINSQFLRQLVSETIDVLNKVAEEKFDFAQNIKERSQ